MLSWFVNRVVCDLLHHTCCSSNVVHLTHQYQWKTYFTYPYVIVCNVSAAVETGYQEEVDGEVGPRQVRGPTPDRAMASLLVVQRRRQYLEL